MSIYRFPRILVFRGFIFRNSGATIFNKWFSLQRGLLHYNSLVFRIILFLKCTAFKKFLAKTKLLMYRFNMFRNSMIYVMRVSMLYAMRIYTKEREIVIGLHTERCPIKQTKFNLEKVIWIWKLNTHKTKIVLREEKMLLGKL